MTYQLRRLLPVLLAAALVAGLGAMAPASAAVGAAADPPRVDALTLGLARNSEPSVGDVDGDGHDDLAIGAEDGILRVFRHGDLDDLLWAAPAVPAVHPICRPQSTPTSIDSSPVIDDVDGDGDNEVIVGMGSVYVPNQNGGLIVFEGDGTVRWRWAPATDIFNVWDPSVGETSDGWCEGVFSTASLGDVNGDGHTDVVFGGWDHLVHALDGRTGRELPGFPFDNVDTIFSSPVLYDVDDDGRDEVFIGGDDTPGIPGHFAGGQFHALDWRDGTVVPLWKRHPNESVMGAVAVVDLNDDGRVEVLVTTTRNTLDSDTRRVLAFHADDGTDVPGWPVETGDTILGSVAVGDLDGDGAPEVVAGSWDRHVYAWNGDGSLLWRTEICCNPASRSLDRLSGHPVISDLDGNGDQDVAIGSGWSVHLLDGRTGGRFAEVSIGLSNDSGSAVMGTPDGGRLLVTSGYALADRRQVVQTYALPRSGAPSHWPQFRGAGGGWPARLCTRSGDAGASTGSDGYWMLESDGTVHAFGDVADLDGGAARRGGFGLATSVDLEVTPDGQGYWILDDRGCIHAVGGADHHGDVDLDILSPVESPTTISATPNGYLVFTDRGRVLAFGGARDLGDVSDLPLNGPVLGSSATPSGDGYYMVASDGGIFAFGDARFLGSMGGRHLNEPVVDLVPDPDGKGYWLVAADGGIFAFEADFRGSVPGALPAGARLNAPVIGAISYGDGYAMVASDGGAFVFSDRDFRGSLGGSPPDDPIVALDAP